jgi:uncharacterized protein
MYRYFYFPDRVKYGTPASAALSFESVSFHSRDGTLLSGWFLPAIGPDKGTVVHMHGNAQNMSAHWLYAGWLPAHGFSVFTFDYRGYGNSQGTPDPRGIFEDAIAALDHAHSRHETLYVFGQSLGGMLAIAAAAARPHGIRAVCAEAPVHSYSAWAEDVMPEKELVLDDTHCASEWAGKLATPLLLLHGNHDRVVPHEHSERIFAVAPEPKRLVTIPGGEHNDAMTERHGTAYQDMLARFYMEQG